METPFGALLAPLELKLFYGASLAPIGAENPFGALMAPSSSSGAPLMSEGSPWEDRSPGAA